MNLTIPLSRDEIMAAWLKPYTNPKDNMLLSSGSKPHWRFTPPFPMVRISSYTGVKAALTHPHLSRNVIPLPKFLRPRLLPLLFNGPLTQPDAAHTLLRDAFNQIVTPHAIQAMLPGVTKMADQLLYEAVAARQPFELNRITDAVTYEAICSELGVADDLRTPAYRDQLFGWFDMLMKAKSPFSLKDPPGMEAFLNDYIDRRLSLGLDGPIDALFRDKRLARYQLIGEILFILVSATTTTSDVICGAVAGAVSLEDRAQFERIRDSTVGGSSKAVGGLYREALRFASPAPFIQQIVRKRCRIDGKLLLPGTMTQSCFVSANRDPAVFANPHVFDPERGVSPMHLGFGAEGGESPRICPGRSHSAAVAVAVLKPWFEYCADWGISEAAFPGNILIRPKLVMCPPR